MGPTLPDSYYRFFFRRLLRVGTAEKVVEARVVGSIGSALMLVLIFIFPDGVIVVPVRMRILYSPVSSRHLRVYPETGEPKKLLLWP